MNVNQSETVLEKGEIRRELRERRLLVDNQQVEEIKPFKSYRRAGGEGETGQKQMTAQGGLLEQPQPLKLKRDYPAYEVEAGKSQFGERQSKFRYDVSGKESENQLAVNYLSQSIRKGCNENDENINMRRSSIKKNVRALPAALGFANNHQKMEVESIIFDSKVRKISAFGKLEDYSVKGFPEELVQERAISGFQEKVDKVNEEIEAGLTNVERMIEELKKKKVAQSQIQSKVKAAERLQKLEKEFADRRAEEIARNRCEEQQKQKERRIKEDYRKEMEDLERQEEAEINKYLVLDLIEKEKQLQTSIERANSPMREIDEVVDSQIQLQGDFKSKGPKFPPQYTTFINRLANQIEKDVEFTNKVNELTQANQIELIRNIILSEIARQKTQDMSIDSSFFRIQPSELDPLDQGKPGWYKKYTEQELEHQAIKLFKSYQDIQGHFNSKLEGKCQSEIIALLFQELSRFNFAKTNLNDSNSVTVGHLLSYLNMRANRSFRNRSFVKMLKRLGLKSNAALDAEVLRRLVKS